MKKKINNETRRELMGLIKRHLKYDEPSTNPRGVFLVANEDELAGLILTKLRITGGAAEHFKPEIVRVFKRERLSGYPKVDSPKLTAQVWGSYGQFVRDVIRLTKQAAQE